MIPDDLRYTADHEWVRLTAGTTAQVGITDFAQDSLGDVVFVQLPEPGTAVAAGEPLGEVESTKSVSDIYAPLAGTVIRRNEALDGQPELVNTDPYGAGWMVEIELADASVWETLLDPAAYQALTEKD